MKVLVTGGSGKIGQFAIAELLSHGHEVINADRAKPRESPAPPEAREVRFVETDLGDVGQVAGALKGCDAVVHLGAIPNPYGHPDEVVFANNVLGTFSVFQAASLVGVKRAVTASSASILGCAWAPEPFAPLYAPIDEEHPLRNHDAYGLAKEVDERTCAMFHRRDGIQIAALRFHWVAYPEEAKERAAQLHEDPRFDAWWRHFWAYVDIRDAALLVRHALEAEGIGYDTFNCTAADILGAGPTEEMIREHTPEVEIRSPIPGHATAWSLDKAKALLGWEPKHSWRD